MEAVFEAAQIATPVTIEENIKRGMMAMKHVIASHKMEPHAMWRKDIGWIGFEWGKSGEEPPAFNTKEDFRAWQKSGRKPFDKGGYGIAHIIAKRNWEGKHIEEFLGQKGIDIAYKLVDVIAKGTAQTQGATALITNGQYKVILRKRGSGKGQFWIITGYQVPENKYQMVFESAVGNGSVNDHTPFLRMTGLRFSVQAWEQQTQPESTLPISSAPCKPFISVNPEYGTASYGFALDI